ncbi:hypothetical protein [Amycolatopsis sp. CB00013]|uniref:hypothetical protein n=1 Tax=Amycolatopsis sp. CB00013 TaxID=1703945 RepID=UPI00093A4120|nr:hypothetical protein [Amycolatopsis sp. CB00013]OKJ98641.1 hypothetical protein AMK34_17495 [Amycolatopsis sp. CB00013]
MKEPPQCFRRFRPGQHGYLADEGGEEQVEVEAVVRLVEDTFQLGPEQFAGRLLGDFGFLFLFLGFRPRDTGTPARYFGAAQ